MPVGENALGARLAGSTYVSSVVGTRVYVMNLPQNPKFPAITYEIISAQREPVSGSYYGTVHSRMQVTSWGKTYSETSQANEGVRLAAQRWSGTSTGVTVHDVLVDNEFTFYDDETETHAHVLDLIVHYEE